MHENLISIDEAGTLDGLFAHRVRRSGDRPAYRFHDRDQSWQTLTWRQMADTVARWQRALAAEGLAAGDRVAIQLRNCPQWVVFDQAALSLGLVVVPLYTDDRPDNIAYILDEADVRLLLVQDAGRWQRLADQVADDSGLDRVLLLDAGERAAEQAAGDPRVATLDDWLDDAPAELQVRSGADPHALASIVYTSGTTGRPKGVMLSHHNMLSVGHAAVVLIDCYEEDEFLSFLPLSHTLERTGGYYVPMLAGACVAYARSIAQLGEDLQAVAPTILVAVPRVFERVYRRVQDQLAQKPAFARWLFGTAVDVGWRHFLHQQGRGGWGPTLLLWPLLKRLVAGKIQQKLGGRLRLAVSGGAPLSPEIARYFIGLGVPIVQGYGLTETSPVISVNPLEENIPESVGPPLKGIEVRVGDDDELLVRGPGVMLGYWNNHAATAQMIDSDGWLHTGDQARLDDFGHIHITGRIKDILVLSNGEKVPPADMEMAIAFDPLIEQVVVVGEGRPYLTALAVLSEDEWPQLAKGVGADAFDRASLDRDEVRSAVLKRIRAALKDFPGYAKVRQVRLTLDPWTIEDGLITPTLKVKRNKVLELFADAVDEMYASGPAA